jgi:hypothetical protein
MNGAWQPPVVVIVELCKPAYARCQAGRELVSSAKRYPGVLRKIKN